MPAPKVDRWYVIGAAIVLALIFLFGFLLARAPDNEPTPPPTVTVTAVPPTDSPPTDTPPTAVPPTDSPPTDVPPTAVPPTDTPPTDVPPTAVPPTPVPPTPDQPYPVPTESAPYPAQVKPDTEPIGILTHWIVNEGDTMTDIALACYGDASLWQPICDAANQLSPYACDKLRVGTLLVVPDGDDCPDASVQRRPYDGVIGLDGR